MRWQRQAYLQRLTLPSTVWGSTWLLVHLYARCPPPTSSHTSYFIHPHTQGCSKANVDVAAWLHVCCSHSLKHRTNGWVVRGWSEFPSSNNSPRQTACIIVQRCMSSHARACKAMFVYPIWTHTGLLHILLLVWWDWLHIKRQIVDCIDLFQTENSEDKELFLAVAWTRVHWQI